MIIRPVLQELRGSLQRCFTPEADELYTIQRERENLQALTATVDSLEQSKSIPALDFDGMSSIPSCLYRSKPSVVVVAFVAVAWNGSIVHTISLHHLKTLNCVYVKMWNSFSIGALWFNISPRSMIFL